jgi:hypothetical protein
VPCFRRLCEGLGWFLQCWEICLGFDPSIRMLHSSFWGSAALLWPCSTCPCQVLKMLVVLNSADCITTLKRSRLWQGDTMYCRGGCIADSVCCLSSWSFNYFFYNKKLKRILYFSCRCKRWVTCSTIPCRSCSVVLFLIQIRAEQRHFLHILCVRLEFDHTTSVRVLLLNLRRGSLMQPLMCVCSKLALDDASLSSEEGYSDQEDGVFATDMDI